jgi:hypothetical protein
MCRAEIVCKGVGYGCVTIPESGVCPLMNVDGGFRECGPLSQGSGILIWNKVQGLAADGEFRQRGAESKSLRG